jgi:hypothetical protein
VSDAEALGYLLHHQNSHGLIEGIPLLNPNTSHMVKGHFANIYFLTTLEKKTLVDHTMEFVHIFIEASSSKLQMAKTQCYMLA